MVWMRLSVEVPLRARGPRRFSAEYKARVLAAYDGMSRSEKGAFLRREGLYSSLVGEWRNQRDRGALAALGRTPGREKADPRDREIQALKHRNQQLEVELSRARRVIEVQGKLSALLGDLATSDARQGTGE